MFYNVFFGVKRIASRYDNFFLLKLINQNYVFPSFLSAFL
ncbi:hypothetical protein BN135_3242 [Cronobacter muytjensii 530]